MRYLIGSCLLFFLLSCGPTPHFSERIELNPEGWPEAQPISFTAAIPDSSTVYNLHLIVDHSTSYRYENIYLKIKTIFPDRPEKEEQLNINLATKIGEWVGDCSGDNCKCKVYLLENFKFPTPGDYTFQLKQYTRNEELKGINSMKLELYNVVAK